MRKFFILSLVLFATAFSNSEIKWHDFNSGYALAKKQHKPAIIDIYADWCKWCKVMDKKTYTNKKIIDIINKKYIAIRINSDKDSGIKFKGKTFTAQQFSQALGVRGLPATIFMDKKGEMITMLPGFIEPKVLLPVLEYIQKECYKKQLPLDDYIKDKSKCK